MHNRDDYKKPAYLKREATGCNGAICAVHVYKYYSYNLKIKLYFDELLEKHVTSESGCLLCDILCMTQDPPWMIILFTSPHLQVLADILAL